MCSRDSLNNWVIQKQKKNPCAMIISSSYILRFVSACVYFFRTHLGELIFFF